MKNYQIAIALLLVVISTSCAYNKKFLNPSKYTENTKSITAAKSKTDSTVIVYNKENFEPTFLKNGVEPIEKDFTLESVIFKSSNGNNLNGWMLKPKTGTITHTIVLLHGNSGSIISQHLPMLPLLKNGFQVFVFDYSGFGFSTGEATRKNLLTDGVSAVDYVHGRSDVKNTKLVLMGHSYGGHLAANVGGKRNSILDAVVIEGGFSNHKDLGSNGAKPFIAFMSRIFIREIYSGTKNISKIKKPLLIIHSTEDTVIPYYMGEKLFKNATTTKELFTIKGGHLDGLYKYTDEIVVKIKAITK
jgi:uncharacterized protein